VGPRNRLLTAAVAAVAATGVALGGVIAAARGPHDQAGAATPLRGSVGTPARPPLKVGVDAARLPRGREPQLVYARGRTVLGGTGGPVKVPGTAEIIAVGRLWDVTLAVLMKSATSSELVVLDAGGRAVRRITGVDSLVTSADGQAAAYATGGRFADPSTRRGTVYFEEPGSQPVRLVRRAAYDLEVVAVVGHTVFFRSGPDPDAAWSLYRWQVDASSVAEVAKVVSPVAVSTSGALAAGLTAFTDGGECTAVTGLSTPKMRWRSCEYTVTGFSPGDVFAVATPPGSEPYGDRLTAALDLRNGNLLREWDAPAIRGAAAEDDDHVLLQWHDRQEAESRSALVRCTVSTGACDLATPLETGPLLLGS
jgi:hypothetical protein